MLWHADADGSGMVSQDKFNKLVIAQFGSAAAKQQRAKARAKLHHKTVVISAEDCRGGSSGGRSGGHVGSRSGGKGCVRRHAAPALDDSSDGTDQELDESLRPQPVEHVQLIHVRLHAQPYQLPERVLVVPAHIAHRSGSGVALGKAAGKKPQQLPITRRTTIADIEAALQMNARLLDGENDGGSDSDGDGSGLGLTQLGIPMDDMALTTQGIGTTVGLGTGDLKRELTVTKAASSWLKKAARPASANAALTGAKSRVAQKVLASSALAMFADAPTLGRGPCVFLDIDRASRADAVGVRTLGDERVRGVGRTKTLFVMDDVIRKQDSGLAGF